jgi:hypothetical protein
VLLDDESIFFMLLYLSAFNFSTISYYKTVAIIVGNLTVNLT